MGGLIVRAKPLARVIARATIGKLPAPAVRLTGALARDGGTPVRDIRFRPWAAASSRNGRDWIAGAGAELRRVFTSGVEGLPQPLAKRFAEAWATFSGTRFALLLPHGTDALRIALASVLEHDGLDYGGEIIVPNFSFIASATAALDRRSGSHWSTSIPRPCARPPMRAGSDYPG